MKSNLVFLTACFLIAALVPIKGAQRAPSSPPKGRALLVGISEYAHPDVRPTRGGEEDAAATAQFIKSHYGFLESEIKVLRGPQATAKNILAEFQRWLIDETQPGDRVFFLYAGHGSRVKDQNNDEEDGFDETLAPYDVKPSGENMILDDDLGPLIAQLSGRLAVLLFDSCHSGTITRGTGGTSQKGSSSSTARYLPSATELAAVGATGSRGAGASDYVIQDLPEDSRLLKTRDLKRVKAELGGPATGIVVISAAQAEQVAFSMDVGGGRQRGALSYVFTQLQSEKSLTLRELQQSIPTRIADLQREGRLKGKQKPVFEIISTVPLEDKPLFGDALTAPAVALANPQSTIKLSLQTREGKAAYLFDETVSYQIENDQAGYLYLLVFSENDVATCIFPTNQDRDNFVNAGVQVFPRPNTKPIVVSPPAGRDTVVALLSATKLDLSNERDYTWSEVFEKLKSKRFIEGVKQTRGQRISANSELTNWQAVAIVVEAIEKRVHIK